MDDHHTVDQILELIQDYGDRERHFGKALASFNDQQAARWNKEANAELVSIRKVLDRQISN